MVGYLFKKRATLLTRCPVTTRNTAHSQSRGLVSTNTTTSSSSDTLDPETSTELRFLEKMNSGGYAVEVTGLSPKATEKDVYDFFAFSGSIDHVEIVRSGECACTAYVTFKDSYSQETACLLSGATIIDQAVCITRWGHYQDEFDFWNRPQHEVETDSTPSHGSQNVPSAGQVVSVAQEAVLTMLAKGFVLGKDALAKAKSLDESHQVSASATARVTELSQRIGLTDKIYAGVGAVKSVDERYHVSEITKSAISETGRKATEAANAVVNSSYFSKGALWVSDALNRAAKAAADLGNQNVKQ
ncbi:binding partner of ACD11 1-like [Pyrus communis]|uniref:binding partner of ACD11 1-like n=1 Tax=Pyrus communis TaxID=23211 RepID=UPI0035C21DDC